MATVALFGNIPFSTVFAVFLLLVYWTQAFFILYHLIRFGIGIAPKILALTFFLGSVVLFITTFASYTQVNLSKSLERFNGEYIRPLELPTVRIKL
ncbi:MAG: hypothetical protein AAB452_02395 [Patescibacteria group bacterium]